MILPFGKYKGQSIALVYLKDPSYINWIASNDSMPDRWKTAAQQLLNNTFKESEVSCNDSKPKKSVHAQFSMVNAKTISVNFEFDRDLLEQFKFVCDGRKWNADDKCWTFPAAQIIKAVDVFGGITNVSVDVGAQKAYDAEFNRRSDLNEIRQQSDAKDHIKEKLEKTLKLPLFDFQRTCVEFVERASGRVLIADQMGIGKTIEAIAFAEVKGAKTLIIAPKSVLIQWQREILKFTGKTAVIWDTTGPQGHLNNSYHIVNYEAVSKIGPQLRQVDFALMIADEATYLKNRKTNRSKAILGDLRKKRLFPGIKTKYVLFLTGTPVLNRPIEAFTLLNFLDPQRFNNFFQFTTRYGGWRGESTRNLDDLHERTKDLVIRRLKSDVFKELPPKQRHSLYVDLLPAETKEYNTLLKTLFSKWKISGKPSVAEMPAIQQYLISKKIPRLNEIVSELLEQNRGALVYCCYVAPLLQLAKQYGSDAVLVHGQMSKEERQESIDKLKSGVAKIGLFSIGAGAMGIDGLQHAIDTLIFLDRFWTPAIHDQAESRLERFGQQNSVSVYYMTCVGTIDEYMEALLSEKQLIADKIVDGKMINFNPQKSYFKEFVKKLRINFDKQLKFDSNFDEDSLPDFE